jgi:hypothetical protein
MHNSYTLLVNVPKYLVPILTSYLLFTCNHFHANMITCVVPLATCLTSINT